MEHEQAHGGLQEAKAMQEFEVQHDDGVEIDETPQDPGQLEGKPKPKHEPPVDSPRWKQVYKGWKENERKVTDLEAQLQEKVKDIEALTKQHKELFETVHTPKPVEQPRRNEVDESERFQTMQKIADLKAKKKQALTDHDLVADYEVSEQIRELERKLEQPMPPAQTKTVASPEQAKREAAVETFVANTDWFNQSSEKYDERMEAYAILLENKMLPSWQGSYPALLKEIKDKVEAKFEYGKAAEKPSGKQPVVPMVESVGGIGLNASAKPQLTDEQRRVARMMFPDNPDAEKIYFAELNRLNKRRA